MSLIYLVEADPTTRSLVTLCAPEGARVEQVTRATLADRLRSNSHDVDALVLGPDVDDPIREAQRIHALERDLAVLILASRPQYEPIVRALRFAPLLGDSVRCVALDDVAVGDALHEAHQRRRARDTIASVNARLASFQAPEAAPVVYLEQLFRFAPIGVVVLDSADIVNGWNSTAEALFGQREREVLGQAFADLFPVTARDALDIALRGEEAPAATRVVERVSRDGVRQCLEITATKLPEIQGRGGSLVVLQDVTSRVEAEEAQRHAQKQLSILSDVGALVGSSLDLDRTLAAVANAIVPGFADWCLVDIVVADGSIRRAASAAAKAVHEEALHELQRRYPPDRGSPQPAGRVLRTGEPELLSDVTDAVVTAHVRDGEHAELLRRLQVRSHLAVPMHASGQLVGVLSLARTTPERQFRADDVSLAMEIAGRCGMAISSAQLYREAWTQARRLEVLAGASQALARLEVDAVLDTIAKLVSGTIGDGCAILLLHNGEISLDPTAVHHADGDAQALARASIPANPTRAEVGLVWHALETGDSCLIEQLTPEDRRAIAPLGHSLYAERYAVHSLILAPLRTRERTLGVVVAWRDISPEPFAVDDHSLLRDLSDRAGLALENAQLYGAAQETLQLRDAFLSAATHDLKTPLASLKGIAQLLKRHLTRGGQPDPARLTTGVDAIDAAATKMTRLVDELLDVSRLQAGRPIALERRSTDLVHLGRQVAEEHQRLSHRHHLVVEAPDQPIVGEWDSGRLERVIGNLVENAIKYSPNGGDVVLRIASDGSNAIVEVSDKGIGIPADDLPRIFERFRRGANVADRISGTGIGLASAHQIVQLHGGRLDVQSEEDVGSTFRVLLPLHTAAALQPAEEGSLNGIA